MIQQSELPQDKPAVGDEQWGFTLWEFIDANKYYLGMVLLLLLIFLYSRSYYNKHK
ncbi:hypothetical protein SAMN04487764_0940 [Gillisia sp. Hel1_33_143]|uniref:hypothetical protein n=1 Tax=unclassified Gillisia TaxID=2615025 RepID=UPI00087D1888|nr:MULTISPECIES: hypothetical protein [unclassified Gillisia]SDR88674.1 hypothetical protein SAMN04487764_0940 [Gillisia sp. Hel1_33_143]